MSGAKEMSGAGHLGIGGRSASETGPERPGPQGQERKR